MKTALFAAIATGLWLPLQTAVSPARLDAGGTPPLPRQVVGGGEVLLEATVGRDGRVTEITPLRVTAPFDTLVREAVSDWRFSPSEVTDENGVTAPAESRVLVVSVFRPPALFNAPTAGEPAKDVGAASDEVPFPTLLTPPLHPPGAIAEGVVLLDARVELDGSVGALQVLGSAPGFDQAAVDAVREWRFRPARRGGRAVASYVSVVLGFPQPVGPR